MKNKILTYVNKTPFIQTLAMIAVGFGILIAFVLFITTVVMIGGKVIFSSIMCLIISYLIGLLVFTLSGWDRPE